MEGEGDIYLPNVWASCSSTYTSKLHTQMNEDVCAYVVWSWSLVHDTQDKGCQFFLTDNNKLVFGQIFDLNINIIFLILIPGSSVLGIMSFTINTSYSFKPLFCFYSGANTQGFPFIFYSYQSWFLFFFCLVRVISSVQ